MNETNKKTLLYLIFLFLVVSIVLSTQTVYAKDQKKSAVKKEELLTRIDFGNSYISGQTLKSGAVYLLQRKKSEMKTMLKYRENYRKEILESHDIHNPVSKNSGTN